MPRELPSWVWVAAVLLAVLVIVETSDIVFAIDSIPAIFAVTDDPFLVFSSNAFAILGLRALYFMLAGMIRRFIYLKVGLSVVLAFVGVKMMLSDLVHVPVWLSLLAIVAAIGVSVWFSLRATAGEPSEPNEPAAEPAPRGRRR